MTHPDHGTSTAHGPPPRPDETVVLPRIMGVEAPAEAVADKAPRLIPAPRRPAVSAPVPVADEPEAPLASAVPENDATAVIPVVGGDFGVTMVIPRIAEGPDVTQQLPALAGGTVGGTVGRTVGGGTREGVYGPARHGRHPTWPTRLGRAPEVLALSACGAVLVALAYAGGRSGASWAGAAFWAGQVLVFAPVAVRMLMRRLSGVIESFTLVMGLAVIQYFQKWTYSPDQFRFPDELQHWFATRILMQGGRLFAPDPALPVAVHFPGLEEMGAAFASMTGLSVNVAGPIVAGIAHLTFVGGLFILVRSTGGGAALSGTTCVIYSTALHYLFFDSMYLYQTAALPFLMLAVWAVRRWRSASRGTWPYAVICLVCVAVAIVSHHVTAAVTVGTLVLIGLCEVVFARPRRWGMLALSGVAVLMAAAWFGLVATDVLGYLGPPAAGMLDGVRSMLGGGGSGGGGAAAPGNPMWQLAVQALGLLALFGLFFRASLLSWRFAVPLDPWRAAVLVGSFAFFVTNAMRFVGAGGPELAGRASTFAYVPMAMVAAGVLHRWAPQLRAPRRPVALGRLLRPVFPRRAIVLPPAVLGTAIALLLMVGARVGGWPPYWEQLPGPHLVSGFERSIDSEGIDAAVWTQDWLGPRNRVAADLTGVTLVSTYGAQDPVAEAYQLYYDPTWGLDDELLLTSLGVDYLWVDDRISQQLPASGAYFLIDPRTGQHTSPIPAGNLTKFDSVAGANLVFDNGHIRIYDMRAA
jgi:hypothetical protein